MSVSCRWPLDWMNSRLEPWTQSLLCPYFRRKASAFPYGTWSCHLVFSLFRHCLIWNCSIEGSTFIFCVSGGGKDKKGVTGPRPAVVFGTRRPAGVLLPAPSLAASHLHFQVRLSFVFLVCSSVGANRSTEPKKCHISFTHPVDSVWLFQEQWGFHVVQQRGGEADFCSGEEVQRSALINWRSASDQLVRVLGQQYTHTHCTHTNILTNKTHRDVLHLNYGLGRPLNISLLVICIF